MAINSRIITGYSNPVYFKHMTSGTPAVTDVKDLARGVDVSISAEVSDVVKFFANNSLAESATGSFTQGTLTMTIDGLLTSTINDIFNHTTSGSSGDEWTSYKTTDSPEDLVVGFIVRSEAKDASTGVQATAYTPFCLPGVKFKESSLSAATQEADVSFQTESLEGIISLKNNVWKYVGTAQATESAALAALKTKMIALN